MKRLGLQPAEICGVFERVRSGGRKHFGSRTLRIERRSPAALRAAVTGGPTISSGPALAALRSQMDGFAGQPDFVTDSLGGIAALLPTTPDEARCLCLMVGFAKSADRPCTNLLIRSTQCDRLNSAK